MPLLDNQKSILRKSTEMYEASIRTSHMDVDDANEDTRASPKLLNREGGEHEINIHTRKRGKQKPQRWRKGN